MRLLLFCSTFREAGAETTHSTHSAKERFTCKEAMTSGIEHGCQLHKKPNLNAMPMLPASLQNCEGIQPAEAFLASRNRGVTAL